MKDATTTKDTAAAVKVPPLWNRLTANQRKWWRSTWMPIELRSVTARDKAEAIAAVREPNTLLHQNGDNRGGIPEYVIGRLKHEGWRPYLYGRKRREYGDDLHPRIKSVLKEIYDLSPAAPAAEAKPVIQDDGWIES
jgi:hypothetical protein